MANNVDRLSRNIHRIVERADIQIPPAPRFPAEAVTGPTISRLAAVARFNGDLQKWRNDRWSVDAPFVTEAELSRSITKLSEEQELLTVRFDVALQRLTDLEARVAVLETTVTDLDVRVTILESEIHTAVPHTILDAVVHTDSVTQTVTAGSLIYGNATPKWDELPIGGGATYLRSDGSVPAWAAVVATEITGTLGVDHGGTGAATLTGIIQGTGVAALTGITGTANYFPKWSATAPYLTSTSLIFGDGVAVGIGQIVPLNRLHVTMTDGSNSTVVDVLRLHHAIGGLTGMASMGTGLLFTGKSDTVDDREMARIQTLWTTAGDASRSASLQLQTAASGTMTTHVTITAVGLVGIGTTTPQTKLTFPVSSSGISLYNTADMVTNYEGGVIKWVNSRFEIGTINAGSGAARAVNFLAAGGQFNFGRTSAASGRFEMNVHTNLTADNTNFIAFRPAAGVTGGGLGSTWTTSGFYLPTSGVSASFSWFGIYPTVTVGGTYSATDFSVMRISPELSGIVGITKVYLINAGTNSGTANTGTHTRLFTVDNAGSTQMAGGLVVGSVLTAAVGGTYYAFLNDGATIGSSTMVTLNHGSSSVPAAGFGTDILYKLESDSTADQDAGALRVAWTTVTNANRTAAMYFRLVNNAASIATSMVLSAAGGLSVGSGTLDALPVGVINAVTGFRANNAAPSGEFLRGNGTNFVSSAILLADLPAGSGVTFDNPTALVSTAAVNGVATTAMRSDAAPAIDQAMGPTWTGGHTWNMGTTSPLAAISLDIAALGSAGTRSSHAIFLRGRSNDGTPHNVDWQYWVNVTSNAGASYFTLEQRIDAVAFASRLNIYSTGLVEVPSFNIGVTQSDTYGIAIANTQPAIAGAANQQWSGPMRWEGQGWETAVGTSMKAEFRAYVAPVQGTAAPTAYWVLEHSINDAAYTELLRADSTGYVRITKNALASIDTTLGQSAFGLQINNDTAATAGVTTQDAPPVVFKLAAWNSSALTSQDWRWRMLAKGVTVAGTTTSYLRIDSGISGSNFGNPLVLYSSGGASLGSVLAEQPLGVLSVQVGFRIAGGAASGQFLRGNGTNFVSAAIGAGDVPAAAMTHVMLNTAVHTDTLTAAVARGALIVANSTPLWARLVVDTANRVLTNNGTDTAWGKVDLAATTNISGVLAVANGGTNTTSGNDQCIAFYVSATPELRFSDTQIKWSSANYRITLADPSISDWLALSLQNTAVAPASTDTVRIAMGLTGGVQMTNAVNLVAGKEQDWVSPATVDSYFDIQTTLNDAAPPTTGLSIRSTGSIICGKDGTGTTRTDDFLLITSSAGDPTGTCTEFGSRVPITYDTTNNTLCAYNPTDNTWRTVALA